MKNRNPTFNREENREESTKNGRFPTSRAEKNRPSSIVADR